MDYPTVATLPLDCLMSKTPTLLWMFLARHSSISYFFIPGAHPGIVASAQFGLFAPADKGAGGPAGTGSGKAAPLPFKGIILSSQ